MASNKTLLRPGPSNPKKHCYVLLMILALLTLRMMMAHWTPSVELNYYVWRKQIVPDIHFILMYDHPALMAFCAMESLRRVTDANIVIWMSATGAVPSHLVMAVQRRVIDLEWLFAGTAFENFTFAGKFGRQNLAKFRDRPCTIVLNKTSSRGSRHGFFRGGTIVFSEINPPSKVTCTKPTTSKKKANLEIQLSLILAGDSAIFAYTSS
jgi:uncharacterized integral membrane protein